MLCNVGRMEWPKSERIFKLLHALGMSDAIDSLKRYREKWIDTQPGIDTTVSTISISGSMDTQYLTCVNFMLVMDEICSCQIIQNLDFVDNSMRSNDDCGWLVGFSTLSSSE